MVSYTYLEAHPSREGLSCQLSRLSDLNKSKGVGAGLLHGDAVTGRGQPLHVVWAEIDREARKGKPLPLDHAPLSLILPVRCPFAAGWASADSRIAARLRNPQ